MKRLSAWWSVLPLMAVVLAVWSCTVARGAPAGRMRTRAGAYELELLVDGVPARTYDHAGETYVLGQSGSRYVLRIHNRSGRRIEAVASVDGLDVMDGKAGSLDKRGYLVPAYGYVDIDGFRLSEAEAAAFRFAPIGESYAAKTGSARNVGVIGVAIFPERQVVVRAPVAVPYPESAPVPHGTVPSDDGELGSYDRKSAPPAPRAEPSTSRGDAESSGAAPAPASPARASQPAKGSASAEEAGGGPGAEMARREQKRERSGLGTEFGEAVSSQIHHVSFVRANASRPAVVLGARYNDRAGLIALGIDVDGDGPELSLRRTASPFPASSPTYARPPADWRRD